MSVADIDPSRAHSGPIGHGRSEECTGFGTVQVVQVVEIVPAAVATVGARRRRDPASMRAGAHQARLGARSHPSMFRRRGPSRDVAPRPPSPDPRDLRAREGGVTGRAWQRMLSGRRLDLLDPSPLDIEIEDIAHGLARVARWNGQTLGKHPYSVAEHSLLVERILGIYKPAATSAERLTCLLHDAPEYVIGDIIGPFKAAIGYDYRAFEAKLESAIHVRFGLPPITPEPIRKLVKRADRASAWFEATQLAGFTESEAAKHFPRPRFRGAAGIRLNPQPTNRVQEKFIRRFEILQAGRGGAIGRSASPA